MRVAAAPRLLTGLSRFVSRVRPGGAVAGGQQLLGCAEAKGKGTFMKARRVSRWTAMLVGAVVVVAAPAVVQVVGAPPASAALPGWKIVYGDSAVDSKTYKSAVAECQGSKRVVGAGFKITGAGTDVILDDLIPGATTVTVGAGEDQDGTDADWRVTAVAVCADPLPGLEIVTAASQFGTGGLKSATAACPSGKAVVGTGAALTNGWGHISIGALMVTDSTVDAYGTDDQDGYSGSWSVTAYAVCATPPPGLTHSVRSSTYGSEADNATGTNCTPGSRPLGLGWAVGGGGQVHVTRAEPDGSGARLRGHEDDNGYGEPWFMTATAICADSL
jgi:hypothetical protein